MIKDLVIDVANILEVYRCKAETIIETDLKLTFGKLSTMKQYERNEKRTGIRHYSPQLEYDKIHAKLETYLTNLKQEIKRKRSQ